jgi:hypothetical protein
LRSLLIERHIVFYRVFDAGDEIARVLHQRRDIEAIFSEED